VLKLDDLLEKGYQASLQGRLSEAAFLSDKVLSKDPSNIRASGLRAIVNAQAGRFVEAIPQLENAVREAPDLYEAWIWLSISYARIGAKDNALASAIVAVKLRPEDGLGLNNVGLCRLALGRLPAAIDAFKHAAEVMPNSTEVAVNLGTALHRYGYITEAKNSFRRAVAFVADSPEAYVALGQALLMEGQVDLALECAEKAVRGDENSVGARRLLAIVHIGMGHGEAAQEHCLKAIELEPTNENGYMMLATAQESQGLKDEAARNYHKALDVNPIQGSAYYHLAFGRHISIYDSEIIAKMESLALDQGLHRDEIKALHYGLGRVFENGGEYEKAMYHFDEANRIAYSQSSSRTPLSFKKAHLMQSEMMRTTFTKELFEKLGA
jgi:superkiller protein 3